MKEFYPLWRKKKKKNFVAAHFSSISKMRQSQHSERISLIKLKSLNYIKKRAKSRSYINALTRDGVHVGPVPVLLLFHA